MKKFIAISCLTLGIATAAAPAFADAIVVRHDHPHRPHHVIMMTRHHHHDHMRGDKIIVHRHHDMD